MILLSEWLVTYWLHSSLFVGAALLAIKFNKCSPDALGESLLKSALIMGIVTSVIQVSGFFDAHQSLQILNSEWQVNAKTIPSQQRSEFAMSNYSKNEAALSKSTQAELLSKQASNSAKDVAPTPALSSLKGTPIEPRIKDSVDNLNNYLLQLPIWLSLFWLAGVLFISITKTHQYFQLKRLIKNRVPVQDENTLNLFKNLTQHIDSKRHLKLTECDKITSPIALGIKEVVLPKNFSQSYNREQVQAALAHELAHIKRMDSFWLWACIAIESLFFIQPLNKVLNKSIYQFADHLSDNLAAKWTGDPRALAEAISQSAQQNFQSRQLEMVPAMTSNKSTLLARIESLIFNKKDQTKRLSLVIGSFLSAFILIAAPGLSINLAQASNDTAQTKSLMKVAKISYSKDDNKTRISSHSNHDGRAIKIKADIEGDLKFNAEETDVVNFPRNSSFEVMIDDGDSERKIEIERRDNDQVVYTYYVDGDKQSYNQQAKDWFASVIPEVLRSTGINAKERVARIKKSHGDAAVLDEVELIQSDFVESTYLTNLFQISKLSDKDLTRAIQLTNKIGSDFEQGRTLKNMLQTQDFDRNEQWSLVFESTTNIGSDFEQAGVLKAMVNKLPENKTLQGGFFEAAQEIGSDFEMRGVFSHYLENQSIDSEGLIAMFKAADEIGSDFELSSLLVEAKDKLGDSEKVFNAYLELSDEIGSDFEMRKTFESLLDSDLNKNHLLKMIDMAQDNIGSDFELASLLTKVIDNYELDSDLEMAIKNAVRSVGSNFERGRVLDVLNNKSK